MERGYYESYQHTIPPVCLCVKVHQSSVVYQSTYTPVIEKEIYQSKSLRNTSQSHSEKYQSRFHLMSTPFESTPLAAVVFGSSPLAAVV